MQGREYDPQVGRFLSVDPYVTDPFDSQSYNQFSYVINNPLKYIDPTGFRYLYEEYTTWECDGGVGGNCTLSLYQGWYQKQEFEDLRLSGWGTNLTGKEPEAFDPRREIKNLYDSIYRQPRFKGMIATKPEAMRSGWPTMHVANTQISILKAAAEAAYDYNKTAAGRQTSLEVAGMMPGPVGVAADLTLAGDAFRDGNIGKGFLNLGCAIPAIGIVPEVIRATRSGGKILKGATWHRVRNVTKGIADAINWKGFSKGSLAEHFAKHGSEFGNITQSKYLNLAKGFAKETGQFLEQKVGNFIVRFDPATGRTLVGHAKSREIRTFYKADARSADPFQAAVDLARQLSGI